MARWKSRVWGVRSSADSCRPSEAIQFLLLSTYDNESKRAIQLPRQETGMTTKERTALIKEYKDGCRQVADALKGISEQELDFHRASGKWSAREIVHHLADSETNSAIRLRKLLVEMNPYIQGFDQDEFAKKLQYSKRPIEPAMKAFEAARQTTGEILDQ